VLALAHVRLQLGLRLRTRRVLTLGHLALVLLIGGIGRIALETVVLLVLGG